MSLLPVLLALALCGGVCVALAWPASLALGVGGLVAALAASTLCLCLRRPAGVLACTMAGAVAAGWTLGVAAERGARAPRLPALVDELAFPGALRVVGVLVEDASAGTSGVRLRLRVESIDDRPADWGETVALTVSGRFAPPAMDEWRAGRRVQTSATLRRPARYLNEGVPDDRVALARRGLTLVGSVKSAALVAVLSRGSGREELAAVIRAHVRRTLAAHVGSRDPAAAAIAAAILIGDRAGLDPALEKRLQVAGTYHVIAISGGNIAVLTAVLVIAMRVCRVPMAIAGPLVALLLIAHGSLVGGGASVARATTMAVLVLFLRTIDQAAWSVNVLAAAACGLVVWRPLAIVDPGFLLSAGATAAIVVVMARRTAPPPRPAWRDAARDVVWGSLATELALLPASAALFNRVTMAGLLLNLAAVPLMAVVQIAASMTVLIDLIAPRLAAVTGSVTAMAAHGLAASSALVDWMPWLALRVPAPSAVASAIYMIALVLLAIDLSSRTNTCLSRRAARVAAGVAVVSGLWILSAPSTWRWPWRADRWLRIVALDVGQGDATLLEFPDGRRWLVDAGGLPGSQSFDVGERVVAPALWHRGTGRLDALVLTHGDPDHIGGAGAVIDDFAPVVFDGIPVPSHPLLRHVRDRAAARGRTWRRLSRGDTLVVGGVQVRVWHPPAEDWERQRVRNDDSIVLELRYGDVSVVLPGDISGEVERALAGEIPPSRMRVLKAAHHGSATSTSPGWLEALQPAIAVVSCGRDNRYGHPAPAVLARLQAQGTTVFRTDQDGEVEVETDGARINVRTFSGTPITMARRREGHR